jgi:hypothetical protein
MKPTLNRLGHLLLPLIILLLPIAVQAQSYTNSDGVWTYETIGSSILIGGYRNTVSATAVTVPATIAGLPVTAIGQLAFNSEYSSNLTSITLPDTIVNIEQSAFLNTPATNIFLGNSLTNIGNFAFENASLNNITIPGTVTGIGQDAFEDCTQLFSATISCGVTTLGPDMFYGCTALTNVLLPNTLTSIGSYAFYECQHMTNFFIPGSVRMISPAAFLGAFNLTGVYFYGNSPMATNEEVFPNNLRLTNYYQSFTTGWSNTFDSIPTATWVPPLPQLGITIYSNQPVMLFPVSGFGTNFILLMSTNLASGNWVTVTNPVTFVAIQVTNVPANAFFQIQ